MGMTDIVKAETQELARPDPMVMLQQMVQGNATPEALGKLTELVERWQDRADGQAFSAAIAQFQGECPVIRKTRDVKMGASGGYKYAALEDIQEIVNPILSKLGLTYDFDSEISENACKVICRVRLGNHVREASATVPVPREMRVNDAQKMGAAIKYAQRYAIVNALGLRIADEDTDAEGLGVGEIETITEQQAAGLQELIEEAGRTREAVLTMVSKMSGRQITKLSEITISQYEWLVKSLTSKKG